MLWIVAQKNLVFRGRGSCLMAGVECVLGRKSAYCLPASPVLWKKNPVQFDIFTVRGFSILKHVRISSEMAFSHAFFEKFNGIKRLYVDAP